MKYLVLPCMFVLVTVFLIGSYGCGSKGGSSVEPTPPTTPTTPTTPSKTISFTPSGNPSSNSVYLEKVSTKGNELTLAVKVEGGTDVFGAAIEIDFDENKISFVSASEGDYLKQGGAETLPLSVGTEQNNNGVLLIGCCRKSRVSSTNGGGVLCKITLKMLMEQANTSIGFNAVNSSLKSPDGDIAGTSFLGGDLSYQ